jgi:hypothetical protein
MAGCVERRPREVAYGCRVDALAAWVDSSLPTIHLTPRDRPRLEAQMDDQKNDEGLAWQISVWDRMVPVYVREIDKCFGPIVERVVKRADLKPGQHVLDLGTGTGSVALRAA